MEQVKASYYKSSDSLESVKRTETNSTKQIELAEKLVAAENNKNDVLIPLQKEYDSLEAELVKF